MNPVHQYRARVARHVGDRETAAEQYRLWAASPRGDMSDCIGCEPSDKVGHLSWLGRYEDAIDVATPVSAMNARCLALAMQAESGPRVGPKSLSRFALRGTFEGRRRR